MAVPLQQCTKQAQRSVVRFLFSEGVKPTQRKHCDQCYLLKPSEGKFEASYSPKKRRELLTTGVCLLHDKARPHPATATVSTIEELGFECIPHPPYSPDLAPSDFHVFGPLKFRDDDEVRSAVHEWLCTRQKEFFSRGIYALVKRCRKCIELEGDYVEQ